jgi:hypothetical protein
VKRKCLYLDVILEEETLGTVAMELVVLDDLMDVIQVFRVFLFGLP